MAGWQIFLAVWMGIGAVFSLACVYAHWRAGDDFSVSELGIAIMVMLIGPLGPFIAIVEWLKVNPNKVLIRGSASAKAFRALSKGD